jgi:RpiB/LacA/LacB family sugar-phosphate isomerase
MEEETMKVYLGSDHAGFKLKEKIKGWLNKNTIKYEDLGNLVYEKKDDYPDYALKVSKKVAESNSKSLGVLVCGSAQGMCIVASKVKGIRAVVPFSIKESKLSREHNNANIICLSGWYGNNSLRMLKVFLETKFSKETRHRRRVNKIKQIEKKNFI